jgi:hypothetical protein
MLAVGQREAPRPQKRRSQLTNVTDIYWALALVAALYAVVLVATIKLSKRHPKLIPIGGVFAVIFVLFCIRILSDNVALSHILPLSNLIVLGKWLPFGAAMMTGLAVASPIQPARQGLHRVVRYSLLVLLNLIYLYHCYGFLFQSVSISQNYWSKGVCLQSKEQTCGPAATATLLKEHGIPATEAEMARLCLSDQAGTSLYGIFRGLKLKTQGTGWDVEMVSLTLDDLRRENALPALLIAELTPPVAAAEPRYASQWGWKVGVPHAVVGIKIEGTKIEIGDPATGREHWPLDAVGDLWHGVALRLIRR